MCIAGDLYEDDDDWEDDGEVRGGFQQAAEDFLTAQ